MQAPFSLLNLWRHIEAARDKRRQLEALPSDTPAQIAAKQALHRDAETAVAKLQCAADALIGLELRGLNERDYLAERDVLADHLMAWWEKGTLEQLQQWAREGLGNRRPLHWPLAFPEIMERGGFDAFVGNPPFIGGKKISGALGTDYRDYLGGYGWRVGQRGSADLCAYFFLRAGRLAERQAAWPDCWRPTQLLKAIRREVGLDQLLNKVSAFLPCSVERQVAGECESSKWRMSGYDAAAWAGAIMYSNEQAVAGITQLSDRPGAMPEIRLG